jgi:hypothetical protein
VEETQPTARDMLNGKRRRRRVTSRHLSTAVAPNPNNAPNVKEAEPNAEQQLQRPGWNHVIRRDRVIKATTQPSPRPVPGPVVENPIRN